MSLSTTLNIAQSSLANNAALSTIVSRNIAGVNDPNYSVKTGEVETAPYGGVKLVGIRNATDDALFANLLSAKSDAASSSALSSGLDQLGQTLGLDSATAVNGAATDRSPATLIGQFTAALQQYAASPADASLGQAAVVAAKTLASSLNTAAVTVQSVRAQADAGLQTSVSTINSLLQQFDDANTAVTNATMTGGDATDALDARNKILSSLSSEIGITTASAGHGGLAIYTDGGATLFQTTARTVTFNPTAAYASGTVGSAVMVDGVPVTGTDAPMATRSGRIAGLAQLRDTAAVGYGDQLDQIAKGLITSFAESDQTGSNPPRVPTIAGLFTAAGTTAIPTAATGLAAALTVAPSVDPGRGGSVTLLRDGGIGGAGNSAYTANTTGAASYSAHLTATLGKLDAAQTFDPTSGGAGSGTLVAYATSSIAWLEAARRDASTASTNKAAVVTQTTTNLSSATGVNLDEQLSKMLDLEHSYQASAELITTVKAMLDSLLSSIH